MNAHFCKVGKTRPYIDKIFCIEELEEQHAQYIEKAYNVKQTDMSLSDILFFEADKLRRRILNLKNSNFLEFDAAL